MLRHFGLSIYFTIFALVTAAVVGYAETGLWQAALQGLFLAAVLGVMETSLSLDNAIVNSKILETMDARWRRRFLTWGILVAVFGMRVVFPLAIVSISGHVNPIEASRIALFQHDRYEEIVTGARYGIDGFGGAFLTLVALSFFVSGEKEHHWLPAIEQPLAKLDCFPGAVYVVAIVLLALASIPIDGVNRQTFLIAAAAGVASFFCVKKFGDIMEERNEGSASVAGAVAKAGAATFVYLEFLDASFSFDGVIGAFAITNDILIIALGLGIGAMFVRSMTLALVEGGQMGEYRYLEHGAFWAIAALAAIMVAVEIKLPEYVTGLIGAGCIGAAFLYSKSHRKTHPEEYLGDEEGEAVLPTGDIVRPA